MTRRETTITSVTLITAFAVGVAADRLFGYGAALVVLCVLGAAATAWAVWKDRS